MGSLKTISIGDVHGLGTWKEVDPKKYDKVIFVGDYVDSFHIPDITIFENLKDILKLKQDYSDKVVLLLGNHDLQYMFSREHYGCSGYRQSMYHQLHDLFNEHKALFQTAYGVDTEDMKYIWTHAGIHTGWYYQKLLPTFKGTGVEELNLAEQLNVEFEKGNPTLSHVGHLRGGYYEVGGPFWLDKRMSSKKPLKYYHQIVGHTRTSKIEQVDFDVYTSVTYIDCLESGCNDFYKLTIYEE
jgi:hypothetical protein